MKKLLNILLIIANFTTVFGQTATQKSIIVTHTPKTVPSGKKWILEVNVETKVQLSEGTFNSGTLCNALFLSSPRIIMNITKGNIYKSEGFVIIFKDPEKVPYTNNVTYTFTPISFGDKKFSLSELNNKKPEDVGVKKLVFKAGESVFVGECLESIEMMEVSMTKQELDNDLKEKTLLKKSDSTKVQNFCIPINPGRYVAPETKPRLKDSLIEYVIFECNRVLFRTREQKGGLDDVNSWSLTLNQTSFEMKGSKGYDKIYKVLGIKYNDQFRAQEFQLADESGKFTHKLDLSWVIGPIPNDGRPDDDGGYTIILSSLDNKDEYQFEAVLKEIKHQNK